MAVPVSKTYAEWAVSTFVLAVGQIGYDSTNDRCRIGNGVDYFVSLPIAGIGTEFIDNQTNGTQQVKIVSPLSAFGEIITAKNRNGEIGTDLIQSDLAHSRFNNIAGHYEYEHGAQSAGQENTQRKERGFRP